MKTLAAVLVATGQPLELAELEIPALKGAQVLVQLAYSGVCHTQLLECQGYRGPDLFLPHCLGHEGSGTVVDVGTDVKKCRPGDRVLLSWIKGRGGDEPGCVYKWNRQAVNAGGVTTFMTLAVVSENRVTPLADTTAMDVAALIGCAAATGAGSVWNAARVQPRQSLAVFGCGGVGLCAVAAGVLAQAQPVIAVDVHPRRLQLAGELGATHLIDASQADPVAAVKALLPGGVDHAVEASGRPSVMKQSLSAVRPRGGQAVVIGNARFGEVLEIDPRELNQGKRLYGTWGGDCAPERDFPRLAEHVAAGDFPLQRLIGRQYSLQQVNEALADLQRGEVARPLLNFSLS